MKIVIQRVLNAAVEIEGVEYTSIKQGFLLYVCIEANDTQKTIEKAAEKISKLRIFEDEKRLMNLNIHKVNGEILSISQFTLSWSGQKGHRPSFETSMEPVKAKLYYSLFNQELEKRDCKVQTGRFGADMKVRSLNDGPVTFHLSFD